MATMEGETGVTLAVTRWRNAYRAVEAHRPIMNAVEVAGDVRRIELEEAHADALFWERQRARRQAYTLEVSSRAACALLLEMVRDAEDDIMEDEHLHSAIDNMLRWLKEAS